MTTRMTNAEREAINVLIAKHQRKHPGCKLNERRCKAELSEDCIGRGDISEFHKTSSTCNACLSEVNREFYQRVTAKKRAAEKAKRKITWKKGRHSSTKK